MCQLSKKEYYPDGRLWLLYESIPNSLKHRVTEYDTLGNVISITFNNTEQRLDSIGYYYDKEGNLKATINFANGQRTGEAKWYYPNGQLKESAYLINDQEAGEHEFYDKDGRLLKVYFYKIINHMSKLNGILIYDNENNINSQKSQYAEIVADQDTINYESCAEYKIEWVCSDNTYVRALTGNIDHNFNVIDSSSLKQVDLDNKNKFYPFVNLKTDTLRVIFELKEIKDEKVYMGRFFLDKFFHIREK
jgi:hypothetical protein